VLPAAACIPGSILIRFGKKRRAAPLTHVVAQKGRAAPLTHVVAQKRRAAPLMHLVAQKRRAAPFTSTPRGEVAAAEGTGRRGGTALPQVARSSGTTSSWMQ
jgi:hypothetical protein